MRPRGLWWRKTWKPECVHHPVGASWCCHCFSVPAHSASRQKCLRTGPNISSKCWVFLYLRRALQHSLGTGCVTRASSASTQLYLGLQAKKVLTLVYKERTKAKVGMSSYLDSILHHCQYQPFESVCHDHEIFLLVQYFESLSSTFGTSQGGSFTSPNYASKLRYTRHLGRAGQSNAQNWENIRLKRKEKNTTESTGYKEGKKRGIKTRSFWYSSGTCGWSFLQLF